MRIKFLITLSDLHHCDMGGAKIADKILIIEKILDKVDNMIYRGGMSLHFAESMGGTTGFAIGRGQADFV